VRGTLPAILGVVLLGGALGLWARWLRQVALEGRRPIAYGMIAAAMVLAVASFMADPGALGSALAGITLAGGAVWMLLGILAPQSRQTPAVAVGEPAPDFAAPDDRGATFRLSDLRGHPVLIKFFRGHW
jgi:hypothetical protein